jgi:hypothetical protein
MKKNVLVIYFTQSGQLREALETALAPLQADADITVYWSRIVPEPKFPFPWGRYTFYDAFPESVFEIPCQIADMGIDLSIQYDLVVLGYQPWFLSPSIPVSSFLQSAEGKALLKGKQVVTFIACRNMWLMAQEAVKQRLEKAGAKLIGNISLFDSSPNLISVVTILYWMLSGKRNRFLGIFPVPGVQQRELKHSSVFGEIIAAHLRTNDPDLLQGKLLKSGAVDIKLHLMSLESRAKKIFRLWASFVLKKGGSGDLARKWRLKAFSYYLPTAIFIASPIVYILTKAANLLNPSKVKRQREYYEGLKINKID